jgi:hypothetical protein
MIDNEIAILQKWDWLTEILSLPTFLLNWWTQSQAAKEDQKKSDSKEFKKDGWNEFNNTLQILHMKVESEQNKIEESLQSQVVEGTLIASKSILGIISQYFLPFLYGWLGSLAYILRTLSREIQDVTFTRGSEIRYSLRWPLGMLAGVTVGLFFDPSYFSGFAVITPLGLAFLAGYGVELLFTGLDRMVSAFTGEGAGRAKTA